jgi:hypothetical protein
VCAVCYAGPSRWRSVSSPRLSTLCATLRGLGSVSRAFCIFAAARFDCDLPMSSPFFSRNIEDLLIDGNADRRALRLLLLLLRPLQGTALGDTHVDVRRPLYSHPPCAPRVQQHAGALYRQHHVLPRQCKRWLPAPCKRCCWHHMLDSTRSDAQARHIVSGGRFD